ncbi:MAG TPA: sigma 54-interacting transcriptional regulator [Nitrospiraceae bacterium]|jgi:Nif-specific regulatory protein|nr:sigma 54-interacting transcriptional regulator [Nitrospiraceae bacterium]
MRAAAIDAEQLTEECAVLEAIVSTLSGPGQVQRRKLDQALERVRERLRIVRDRLTQGRGDLGEFEGHAGAGESKGSLHASLVGNSDAMRQVYEAIRRVSHSHATVLLRGESGTGKELVAKAIHLESPRSAGPFVGFHCAAVTETLLESELFGHERGAFTGAVEQRKGRFEQADGGTLFLDEIGDIPPATQVKLLRVIQERCFERVGGNRLLSVDVRVISATHRDLEAMVLAGTFREDLYYRLNVVPIALPSLRARAGDIPLLIEHFLARFNRENRRQIHLGRDLMGLMARYHWPGNVRELQNCMERLVVMAEPGHDMVSLNNVPPSLQGYFADMRQVTTGEPAKTGRERAGQPLGESLQEMERRRLHEALERTGWVQARAARVLGISPRQVAYKMRKYGIRDTERGSN